MLSQAENDTLTRVGPGHPAGELLRRYWLPVAPCQELTDAQPTKFVRILGEDLVLFRDKSGQVGLIADRCVHRGASMCYGRTEERGISCAYHGWLYDTGGNILETPPERNDAIMRSVKQKAYPVQKFMGLYWAYLGPLPAPVIPHYDLWVRRDGTRRLVVQPQLDCNWFQAMENSVDPAHLQILHQEVIGGGRKPINTTRGFTDDVASSEFRLEPFGIVKKRTYINGRVDEHPLIFPNILRQGNATQIRVPIDDTHTYIVFVRFDPTKDGSEVPEPDELPLEYMEPYKQPATALHPQARFRMDLVQSQDHMAWETQGPIADRTTEHLSYSDRGVHMLRRLLLESIDQLQAGIDPMGVQRDPNHPIISTNLEAEGQAQLGGVSVSGVAQQATVTV